MSIYVVPQRELKFIFEEIVSYNQHCQMPGFEEASADLVEVIPESIGEDISTICWTPLLSP